MWLLNLKLQIIRSKLFALRNFLLEFDLCTNVTTQYLYPKGKYDKCLKILITKGKPIFSFIKVNKQSLPNSSNISPISQVIENIHLTQTKPLLSVTDILEVKKISNINTNKKQETGTYSIFAKIERRRNRTRQPVEVKLVHDSRIKSKMVNLEKIPIMVRSKSPLSRRRFSSRRSMNTSTLGWPKSSAEKNEL